MNREEILRQIDENNEEIVRLQRQLASCYKRDRYLASQLVSERPVSYTSNEQVEQRWEGEGGSHAKMSPFTGRKPSFNEFVERLTHCRHSTIQRQ